MTLEESKKRIEQITRMQLGFDGRLTQLDETLTLRLIAKADELLEDPVKLSLLLSEFERSDFLTFLKKFGSDLIAINKINQSYFKTAVGQTVGELYVNLSLFNAATEAVNDQLTERFGVSATGKIISNGYFDTIVRDTTVRRQLQQFAYQQKVSGVGLQAFKKNVQNFVKGSPSNPNAPNAGIYTRHFNTFAYDTYQQVDRAAQKGFSEKLGLTAFLYLGGIIAGSRTWCRVRNGKCFIRAEIDKFGTSADTYGGYENKSVGYFAGKNKTAYVAFTDLGGYGCRHHLSAISNKEALLRRDDLKITDKGVLVIS